MVKLEGRIDPQGGEGNASKNYKAMIPKAAEHCSEIRNCDKYGTINVIDLSPPLRKSYADCWTPTVIWPPIADIEKLGVTRKEAFGFIKIKFEYPLAGETYDAWIIFPEGHGFTYNEDLGVEIIAEMKVPGIKLGQKCAIHIDHSPSVPRPRAFGANFGYPPFISNPAAVPA
jgi:hypothetical protein